MQKTVGAILLVAGTCIGSGMIALPMVLAKLGLVPSILLMLFIWVIMYYTSLVNLELNLRAGHGLSLGALGKLFSGKIAEFIGTSCLKLLSYSLLAVFIYGGSSVTQELITTHFGKTYAFDYIAGCYAMGATALLLLPIRWIDYLNRFLFVGLLAVVAILLGGLVIAVDWSHLPLFSENYTDIKVWAAIIPVVFTSFGFQVIFHTLTNYCHKNIKMLKLAFFWGSLIPAIVYVLWTSCVLSVVYHDNPSFYTQMTLGNVEVGELIQALSSIAKWHAVQLLVWWISLLAIATSVIGVGVGLCETLQATLFKNRLISAIVTILPAYFVVIYVPNAFIAALGFAGMILAIIAVLLPIYLLGRIGQHKYHYPELEKKWLIGLSVLVGIAVIVSEIFNMV